MLNNLEIRLKIKQNRLLHYEIAKQIGISEFTLCKWLRYELDDSKKNLILSAINNLTRGDKY